MSMCFRFPQQTRAVDWCGEQDHRCVIKGRRIIRWVRVDTEPKVRWFIRVDKVSKPYCVIKVVTATFKEIRKVNKR